MHTHFGSGTHALQTFLSVLILGAFWRLAWLTVHSKADDGSFLKATADAALLQF
jgi:hypothetical protein